ncbi:ArsR/SmtB family transcription factor [Kytococcus sp. Marseille-QA3725]
MSSKGTQDEQQRLREQAAGTFRVLSSPLRIQLIELLAEGERTVSDLVEAVGQSQPLVSQHLRVLRDQCLVSVRREGRVSHYSILDDHVLHVVADTLAHASEHDHTEPAPRERGEGSARQEDA